MKITEKTLFKRAFKKLNGNQQKSVERAIKDISAEIKAGKAKKAELAGIYVYKFDCVNQQYLLAYQHAEDELILYAVGTHENFYRDLKNNLKS